MGIVAAMEAMLLNDTDSALGRKICRLREMSIRRRRTRSQIHRRSIWRSGHMSRVGLTSGPASSLYALLGVTWRHQANVRQIAVALRIVHAITDYKEIRDREAYVISFDFLDAPRRFVEQRGNAK